jgi:hypothetical protein
MQRVARLAPSRCPSRGLASSLVLILASTEGVAGITAGATLAAALALAGITAWTTNRRQKRDLAAEAERQADALSHERELHDLADLRKLLDEAAVALDRAVPAEVVDLRLTPYPRQLEAKSKMDDDASVLDVLHARLSVRLGPRHKITLVLGEATASLRRIGNQIPRGEGALDAEAIEVRGLWGTFNRSGQAARVYSWIRPPSWSRRWTAVWCAGVATGRNRIWMFA